LTRFRPDFAYRPYIQQMSSEQTGQRFTLVEALGLVGIIVLLTGALSATYSATTSSGGTAWGVKAAVDLVFALVSAACCYMAMSGPQTENTRRIAAIASTVLAISVALLINVLIDQAKIFSNDIAVIENNLQNNPGALDNTSNFAIPTEWSSFVASLIAFGIGGLAISRWRSWLLVTLLILSGAAATLFFAESTIGSPGVGTTSSANLAGLIGLLLGGTVIGIGYLKTLRGSDYGEFLWLAGSLGIAAGLYALSTTAILPLLAGAGLLVFGTLPNFYSRGLIAAGVLASSSGLIGAVSSLNNGAGTSGLILALAGVVVIVGVAIFVYSRAHPATAAPAGMANPYGSAPAGQLPQPLPPATPLQQPQIAQPTYQAPTPTPTYTPPTPAAAVPPSGPKDPPRGALISDDKTYWWDESVSQWHPLKISPDHHYYWDGERWQSRS
jgi:hypothetical protein